MSNFIKMFTQNIFVLWAIFFFYLKYTLSLILMFDAAIWHKVIFVQHMGVVVKEIADEKHFTSYSICCLCRKKR